MAWGEVGSWIKEHAPTGAKLVGSLLTGGVPAAVATGVSIIASATGTDDPIQALETLKQDPKTMIRLKELANQNEASIREHVRAMAQIQAEEFKTGQQTVQFGDKSESAWIRFNRPGMAWVSLGSGVGYVFAKENPDLLVFMAFLILPFWYSGLRGVDKVLEYLTSKLPFLKNTKTK